MDNIKEKRGKRKARKDKENEGNFQMVYGKLHSGNMCKSGLWEVYVVKLIECIIIFAGLKTSYSTYLAK